MATTHTIKKIVFDADASALEAELPVHKKLKTIFEQRLQNILSKLLDKYGDNVWARLETLELDLGTCEWQRMDTLLPDRFAAELERKLARLQLPIKAQKSQTAPSQHEKQVVSTTELDLLLYWLEHGSKPWWASTKSPDLATLFAKLLRQEPQTILALFKNSNLPTDYLKRLTYTLKEPLLKRLLMLLIPAQAESIHHFMKLLLSLQKREKVFKTSLSDLNLVLWNMVLRFVAEFRYGIFNQKDLLDYLIESLAIQNDLAESILIEKILDTKAVSPNEINLLKKVELGITRKEVFLNKNKEKNIKDNYLDRLNFISNQINNKFKFNPILLKNNLEYLFKFKKNELIYLLKNQLRKESSFNYFIDKSNHIFFKIVLKNILSNNYSFLEDILYNFNYFHKIKSDFKISTNELDFLIKKYIFEYIFLKNNYLISKKSILYFLLKKLIKKIQIDAVDIFDAFIRELKNPQNSFRQSALFLDLLQNLRIDAEREGILRRNISNTIIKPYDDAELLRFYFTNGILPWSSILKRFDAEALILKLLEQRLVSLRRVIYDLSAQPAPRRRLLQSVSANTLSMLLAFFAAEELIESEEDTDKILLAVQQSPHVIKSYLVHFLRQGSFPNQMPLNFGRLMDKLATNYLADAFLLLTYLAERSDLTQKAIALTGEDTLMRIASFLLVPDSQANLYQFVRAFPLIAAELEGLKDGETAKYLFWEVCLYLFKNYQRVFDADIWLKKAIELKKIQNETKWYTHESVQLLITQRQSPPDIDSLDLNPLLEHFLENLSTPQGFSFAALESLFIQKIDAEAEKWLSVVRPLLEKEPIREQWVLYFSEPLLNRLAFLLEPLLLPKLLPSLQQILRALSRTDWVYNEKVLLWCFVFEELASDPTHTISKLQLAERFCSLAARELNIVPQFFVNSLLPHLSLVLESKDLEALKGIFSLREDAFARPIAARTPTPRALDEDDIYIANAGLVLLHPFLGRLFKMLELLDGKKFKDENAQFKALHLLQYMVFEMDKRDEHDLVFNKVLVGLSPQAPIPLRVELTEREKALAASLVMGAVQNWKALKNTTLLNFRVSFLQREGKLKREGEHYRLVVDQRGYDLLLSKLPWSVSMIKQSWLPFIIYTDWR